MVEMNVGLFKANTGSTSFPERTMIGVSSFLHIAHGLRVGAGKKKLEGKKGTEIDAIASLSPISWRHSSLAVVTEWDSSQGGHQVTELDNPHPTPIAPPRKRINGGKRRWRRHYSALRPILFNIKSVDHAKEMSYSHCKLGEGEETGNTCYLYCTRSNIRSRQHERIYTQTENSISFDGKGTDTHSISSRTLMIKYFDDR
jgi:hypothetical protein